ncbi:hypothetical protein ABZ470_21570 [Streptosporangium sp. NPDC020072]|uniref:hypothetical protein n=1 Tax=Streptosporangium sp. NPDC020072 TaxID=3154788 RepID=UPI00342988E7
MFDSLRTLPSRVVTLLAVSALAVLAAFAAGAVDTAASGVSAAVVAQSGTGWQ